MSPQENPSSKSAANGSDSGRATATATAVEPPPKDLQPGEVINNRYRVVRKLGHGGMGSVFLVEDGWRANRQLALKRVRKDRLDDRAITILRNEYLALSPLLHPNLARVYDFEVDLATQDYFFTSEYVDGVQLLQAAREFRIGRRGDFHRFLEAVVQMLRALEFIHSRGLVHGDIKPENVLITGSLCDPHDAGAAAGDPPRVKMIDFGLTKREKEFGGKRIVGTTYYIAPETILGSQIDRRTDLYSLGVVLYHLTTRKLPFTGKSNLAVLRGHIEQTPLAPNLVETAVPEPLSQIILRLMDKQPSGRYGTALEVLVAINDAFATDFSLETPESRLSYIQSGGFIAREQDMTELTALFESVFRVERAATEADDELNLPGFLQIPTVVGDERGPPPAGRMVLIRGEAGVGKRRLMKEFRRFVQTRGVHFIEIDCAGAGGPQHSFAELVHAQVGILSARAPGEAPSRERLDAFLESVAKTAATPFALRPIVEKLAFKFLQLSRATPLVLSFSEIHRADRTLLEFLRAVVQCISEAQIPDAQLIIVASAEDDEVGESLLRPVLTSGNLHTLIRELRLRRFTCEEVGRQVAGMFGGGGTLQKGAFPERLIELIYEESDGNPGVVQEIMEFLVSGDLIRRTSGGWVAQGSIERDSIPGKVRRELGELLKRLDPFARRLGAAMALIGGECELDVAARLAETPPGKIIEAVLTLKQNRIIREEPGGEEEARFSFVHSSARELLYAELPEEARPAAHDRAGQLLETYLQAAGRKDPRRLAFHFLRAGNAVAALRYGLDAAREYASLHHPRKAIEVYGEIRRFALADDPTAARQIDRQIAGLHFHIGEYRQAAEILQGLAGWKPGGFCADAGSVPDPKEQALDLISLGDALCHLGNFREATSCLQEAFQRLKGSGTTPELASLLLGFANLYHRRGNFAESLRYCERVAGWEKGLGGLQIQAQLNLLLANNHFGLDNKEIAAKYCQKGLEALGSLSSVEQMALTLECLGKFYYFKGRFKKALKNLQHCAMVNQKMGALDRQAECLREIGEIYLGLDKPQEALNNLALVVQIYDRTENLAGTVEALNLRAEALRLLGCYEDARRDVQLALQKNSALGNPLNASKGYLTCARIDLDHGRFQRACNYLENAERCKNGQMEDRSPLRILVLRCAMETMRGEFQEALDLVARATIASKEVGNRLRTAAFHEQQTKLYLVLGRHLEARRSLTALQQISERYGLRVMEGRVYLLQGVLLYNEGRTEEALACLEKALAIFREEQSERDLVPLYLEFGQIQLKLKNYEQAYVLFEEGLYLAKKLNLAYAKCRLYHLMGVLETLVPEGVFAKAVSYFFSAERFAKNGPYPDLLWRIRHDLGKFYLSAGRWQNADRVLTEALEDQRAQLEKLPHDYRYDYLAASGREDLEDLQAEARARAEVQARKEQVKYPPRDPSADNYFGLVGRSAPMKELFRKLSGLAPDEPWVWIFGPDGSGRREVARAIHRQSVPDREHLWTYSGSTLKSTELEKFFLELDRVRGDPAALPPAAAAGASSGHVLAFPGRFTLVVSEAGDLPNESQKVLLDRVLAEKVRDDGLRVIAALDRSPAGEGETRLAPELTAQGFPEVRVPALSERGEDLEMLLEHFLRPGPKEEGQPSLFTPEALEAIRKLTFREQLRDLRELCEKIGRFAVSGKPIDLPAIRTAITPTLSRRREK